MKDIFTFDAGASRRSRDTNGFLIVKDNPIAKAGVYEYYGREIGAPEVGRKYKVYRSFDELRRIKDGFAGKPVLLEHEWVNPEQMPQVRGAITGEVREEEPYLYADVTIYDAEAADAIENGSYAELSPGYVSDYDKEAGEHDGETYEYVQRNIRFNHLALVREGRTGKDLRVMDGKNVETGKGNLNDPGAECVWLIGNFKDRSTGGASLIAALQDSKAGLNHITGDGKTMENKENETPVKDKPATDEDRRALIREIMAVAAKPSSEFKGGEEEHERTIAALAEKLAYRPSEGEGHTDDDDPDGNDEPALDANTAAEAQSAFDAFAKVFSVFLGQEKKEPAHRDQPEAGGARTQDGKPVKTLDAAAIEKQITARIAASQKAYSEVLPYTGAFNVYTADGMMSEGDIYAYAYKCVGGDPKGVPDSKSAFLGHIAALDRKKTSRTFDGAPSREIEEMTAHIK